MRGKATGALVGEGAVCLSLSLSRAAAVDEDAEAPRFVVDDVAEELAGRIGTCLGVRAVSVVCVCGGEGVGFEPGIRMWAGVWTTRMT